MLALKNGTKDGKSSHQNHGSPEGDQAAAHRRADAVGCVVGADVPTNVDPGADENEKDRFYGLSSVFMESMSCYTGFLCLRADDESRSTLNKTIAIHKSNQ
jgi:hypothetical protein